MGRVRGLNLHGSELSSLEYSIDSGVTWHEIPGVMTYREQGGEAPVRFQAAFKASANKIGLPRVQSVAIGAFYSPSHAAWEKMRDLAESLELTYFRMRTVKEVLHAFGANHTAKITAGTSVTKAGVMAFAKTSGTLNAPDLSSDDYAPGQVVTMTASGKYYIIDSINGTPAVLVRGGGYEGTTITPAGVKDIRVPATERKFLAWVAQTDVVSLELEDDMRTPLILAAKSRLPKWKVLTD